MPLRGKAKQTQLTFAPVTSTPPSGPEHNPGSSPGGSAKLRYDRPFKSFLRRGPKIDDYLARREDLSPGIRVTPRQSSEAEKYPTEDNSLGGDRAKITENSSSYSNSQSKTNGDTTPDEDTVMVTTRRQRRNKADAAHDEADSDTNSGTKAKEKGKPLNINAGSKKAGIIRHRRPSDNPRSPRIVVRENLAGTRQEATSREADSAARQPEVSDLESAEPTSPRESPRVDSLGSNSPGASDADEIVTRPTRRLRRGPARKEKVVVLDESDESDEEPILSSPAKRRRRNTDVELPQTPKRESEQDKLDLEEDLQDLQDSVVKETRTRGRPANSAREKRQQQLEALRRRRTGERVQSISESEPESEDPETRGSDFEVEVHSGPRLEERLGATDESDIEPEIPGDENLDRYEDDFVLQDDESIIGVPTDMPFEFSRHAYKQPKEYFRDAVEWMVHNKLNPAFPRSDALYEVAFIKLEDEVKGRIGSQIVSTVWAPGFHRALMARPHIEVTWYPASENHPCDACNRSRHPATFNVHFFGKAYSLQTLEPVYDDDEDSDDEDEDEERDNVERDRDGNVLPDEDTRFLLGRHCKTKATMAHTLSHWRFHLNEWVVDHLAHQGILTDENILERSHWSVKKQTKYANEIVDMMDRSTEIQKLWRDFHITLKAARETAM